LVLAVLDGVVAGQHQLSRAGALTFTAAVARSSGGGQPRQTRPEEKMPPDRWTAGKNDRTMTQGTGTGRPSVRQT
jgi:hypothetical protein